MRRFPFRPLLPLILAIAATTAHAAEDCGFLPTSEVDEAFAEFAPWHTMVGGAVGHCTFLSDKRSPPNSVSFMQQFKSSRADANDVYEGMRQGLTGEYAMKDVKALGDRAFRYEPKDGSAQGPRTTSITAQKDRLVITVMLNLQRAVTEADVQAASRLGQFALRGPNDADMQRKAATCPWFDEGGLKKLFGGRPYEVQVHGENSCMALDKQSRVLLLSAMEARGGLSPDALRAGDCQTRDVPELDKNAKLSFACKSGNPRAETSFVENGLVIQLTWAAGVEPGEAEKTALIELAKSARELQAAR
ncbi:hypothetical protein [Thauera butanivorans]|uniref:hypothetical protein n=1 Tax=Thauera butanivorans TaxID=86174 RepID=UPI00083823B8|nr:hypothetical protein [Thauera butanivorans]